MASVEDAGTFGTSRGTPGPSTLGSIATEDLDRHILRHLTETLSSAAVPLVTRVETWKGWGDMTIVTVFVVLSKREASPTLAKTIHEEVGRILKGRHYVDIRWGTLSDE